MDEQILIAARGPKRAVSIASIRSHGPDQNALGLGPVTQPPPTERVDGIPDLGRDRGWPLAAREPLPARRQSHFDAAVKSQILSDVHEIWLVGTSKLSKFSVEPLLLGSNRVGLQPFTKLEDVGRRLANQSVFLPHQRHHGSLDERPRNGSGKVGKEFEIIGGIPGGELAASGTGFDGRSA